MSRAGSWGHCQGSSPATNTPWQCQLQVCPIHRDRISQPGVRPHPAPPQGQSSMGAAGLLQHSQCHTDPRMEWQETLPQLPRMWVMPLLAHRALVSPGWSLWLLSPHTSPFQPGNNSSPSSVWGHQHQPSSQAGNEGFEEFVFQAPSGCCFPTSPQCTKEKGKHKRWDLESRARQSLAQWNDGGRAG